MQATVQVVHPEDATTIAPGQVGVMISVPSKRSKSGAASVAFVVNAGEVMADTYVRNAAFALADFNGETSAEGMYREAILTAMQEAGCAT